MKKILWLCNAAFSDRAIANTGSWLQPLAVALQRTETVQIYNVTLGDVAELTECHYEGIRQWIIPRHKTMKYERYGQIPLVKICEQIRDIEREVQPDLVHIWGTEYFWATIYRKGYLKSPALMDIQGLLSVYTDFYYGGLTFSEILRCIHLKEIILPWRFLPFQKRAFKKRGKTEIEHLKNFRHISVQSQWVKNIVSFIHPDAHLYETKILLRDHFFDASPWQYKTADTHPVVFSMCSGSVTYKGIHVLFKAIKLLKNKYPHIKLNLAGEMESGNLLLNGFSIFLKKLIKKLNLEDNVCYLGSINAVQIISNMQNCNVCVVPSFIETYCLAFAEAMMAGVPTVVSFTGAMPELAEHQKSALFYNPLDYRTCAAYIDLLIQDKNLAETLSYNGREKRLKENDRKTVVDTQLNIYESVLNAVY